MAFEPRIYTRGDSKPGGWYNVEDFFNELKIFILNSQTEKALAVAVVDSNGDQVTAFGGSVNPPSSISSGSKNVSSAGTAETLGASVAIKRVFITARRNNQGEIVFGGSNAKAAIGVRVGTPLSPGDTQIVEINDLSKVYIDAEVSGDGISYTYEA